MALCLSLISNRSTSDAFDMPGWSRGTSKPFQLARDISNVNLPSLSHTSTGNTHIHTGRIRHLRPSTLLLYKHTSGYGMPTPPLSNSSDPYAILGLVRHANGISKSDIKSAYRRAALLYHPDVRTDINSKEEKDGANDDFARINAAYAYLVEELENKHKKEKERMNKTPARRTNTNMNVHGAYSRSYADRHIQRKEKAQAQERQKRTSTASASYWSQQGYDGYGGNRHKTTSRNPEAEKAARSSSQKPKAEELKTKKQRRATYSGTYHHDYGAANGTDTSAGYNQNKSYVGAGIKRNGSGSSSNYSHSYAKAKSRTAAPTTAAKYTRTSGANGSYWVRHGPNGPGPGSVNGVNAAAAHGHSFGGRSPTPRKQTASVTSTAAKSAAKKAVPYVSVKNSYEAQYSRVTQTTMAPKVSHKMPAGGASSTSIPISPTPKKRSNKPSVSQGHTDSRIPFYAQSVVAKKESGAESESTSIPNAPTPKTSTEKSKTPYTRIYEKSVNGSRTASSTLKNDNEISRKPNDSPKIWGDFSNSERFHQQFNSFPQVRQPSNTMNQAYSQPTTNSTKVSYPTYAYNYGKYNYEGVVTLTEGAVDVSSMNANSSGGLDRPVTTANTDGGKARKWGDFSDSRSFHERFNPSPSAQSFTVSPVSNATDYYQKTPLQAPSVPVASEYVPPAPVPTASAHTTHPPAQSPTVPTASEYATNHHAQSPPVPETPAGHHQHSPAQSSPAPVTNTYAHHQKPPTQSPQAPVSSTTAFHQTHSTLTSSTSSSTVTATSSTHSTDSTENLQSSQTQKAEKDNVDEAKKKGNKWADFFGNFAK
eukprot:CAMPEP_0194087628 /NCGR_PEP_ID=MMETSP0149-20130528/25919_1 /TAXON_ID=122233 /ORGANISM="Chaetoceros debilis, Strain MM31A-1" /LENGTH=818 /DNA_ID=CAMNT_0038771053 /DNA_START=60 /DNA_END=2516 /DNA_ORIENTATION=+